MDHDPNLVEGFGYHTFRQTLAYLDGGLGFESSARQVIEWRAWL